MVQNAELISVHETKTCSFIIIHEMKQGKLSSVILSVARGCSRKESWE